MISKRWARLFAVLLTFGLVAAACGDSDDGSSTSDAPAATTAAPATTAAHDDDDDHSTTTAAAPDTTMAMEATIADVCPNPVIVQTDWFPEAEHGATYNLIGDDYTVDTEAMIVTGSLVASGADTGVDIEVRTGGPAIGFSSVASHMYVDTDITLGFVSNDQGIILHDPTPTIAVVAPLEKNPQIIMWDPGTYPDVKTIADLGTEGVTIQYFGGGVFMDVFVAEGILSADQIDPSYDGSPARFIAEGGAIAQQGFASAEPYQYLNTFEEWGKEVGFQLLHDTGYEIYSQPIAIREADLDDLRPCLELLVPVIQQATVDYYASPERANGIVVDAVEQYASFWSYSDALAAYSAGAQVDLGLASNGPDGIVGNMDQERVQSVIDKIVAAGVEVAPGLTAADITTNEFIDESIGH